jgi:uncharacterized protein YrrD
MFRTKDFLLMDVVDIKGKKIGFINDIIVDFNSGEVRGFVISSYRLLQKSLSVLKEDIVSFNKSMVISKCIKKEYLTFSKIRNMDIIDKYGEIMGLVEDILFHEFTFKIQGIVVSTGFIKNLLTGKRIILANTVIIGEESVLYYPSKNNFNFISIPHKLFTDEKYHEKNI